MLTRMLFLCVKMYHPLYCPLYAESTSNLYIQLIIADATPRMAFSARRTRGLAKFAENKFSFDRRSFSYEASGRVAAHTANPQTIWETCSQVEWGLVEGKSLLSDWDAVFSV